MGQGELTTEWTAFTHAPILFISAVLALGVLIWRAVDWHYKGRHDTLKQQLEHKDGLIADYKEKLKGATPEEAKDRIDGLERRLAQLIKDTAPWKLTNEQEAAIMNAAREMSGYSLAILFAERDGEARQLAGRLAEIYQAAGWRVMVAPASSTGHRSKIGITVVVANEKTPTGVEQVVINGFRAAQLEFGIHQAIMGNLLDMDVQVVIDKRSDEDDRLPSPVSPLLQLGTRAMW